MAKYQVFAFLKEYFPISQYYGDNVDYYKQVSNGGLQHGHEGIDIATPNGTEIYAPLNGIVVRDGSNDRDYGNFVVIWDPIQKCGVWFCHLQDVVVSPSDPVKAGQLVAHTNNTGNTRGAHVHVNFVETDENGYRINMDNGEEGFLNLLDPTLVDILPFPGLQPTDPQMPKPTSAQTVDATAPVTEPVTEAPSQQPVPQTTVDAPTFDKLVANSTSDDAICDFLGLAHNSSKEEQLAAITAMKVDLTTKLKNVTDKYMQDLGNYQVMQAAGYDTLDAIDKKVVQLENDNQGLQKQVLEISKENVTYLDQLKAKNDQDATAIDMGINAQSKVKELESALQTIASAHNTKPTVPAILTAIDKLKTAYDDFKKQLQKKNIKQDIQIASAVAQEVIPAKVQNQSAWDFVANLFMPQQGKAVK